MMILDDDVRIYYNKYEEEGGEEECVGGIIINMRCK